MSLLPTKTVSVQIKLDLRRPGTFNYPKYPHPKYHQRRCDLTSTRINGVLTKFLTLRASHPNRLPVCMEWQTVFFSSVWVWTTVHTRGRNEKRQNDKTVEGIFTPWHDTCFHTCHELIIQKSIRAIETETWAFFPSTLAVDKVWFYKSTQFCWSKNSQKVNDIRQTSQIPQSIIFMFRCIDQLLSLWRSGCLYSSDTVCLGQG